MIRVTLGLACAIGLLFAAVAAAQTPAVGKTKTTLDNLQEAYNGESNAQARYLAFAERADDEGYSQVASLFRAAARAEEVHANAHADIIRKLGGQPKAEIASPDVKTTAENLQAAIAGESYERDKMYPDFITLARKDGNTAAVRTFNLARKAEAEHAKLYREALDNLAAWKGGKKDFFVCSVCGFTTTKLPGGKCPSCFESADKYEKVN